MTFQTFDESDEETRLDQKKNNETKTMKMTMTTTKTMTNTFREHPQRVPQETCDL